jgi:hypothetical protein
MKTAPKPRSEVDPALANDKAIARVSKKWQTTQTMRLLILHRTNRKTRKCAAVSAELSEMRLLHRLRGLKRSPGSKCLIKWKSLQLHLVKK